MKSIKIRNLPIFFTHVTIGSRVSWAPFVRPMIFVAGVLTLWGFSLQGVDPGQMNDLGLISVLPPLFYISLALLFISFAMMLHEKGENRGILLLHVATLIVIIHATPQILYGTLRYSWAWKHVGIVDYIQRHGSVDPTINFLSAYHDWPGFFALSAFFTEAAGFKSALSFAGWGPVFFNLLDLGALLLIFKTFTHDWRLIWLSVWIFFLASWVGQDYFSPQALAYFLFLVMIGITLQWFRVTAVPSKADIKRWVISDRLADSLHTLFVRATPAISEQDAPRPVQRLGLMAILILIFFVIASSHQLTPLMAIGVLTALVLFQITTSRSLPFLMAAITVSWIIFMGVGFLDGNLSWIIQSIGLFTHNFNANLINLAQASQGQVIVAWMDRGLSAFIWGLALLGSLRRIRNGQWDLPAIVLALAPIPMLAANSYGGEILFRVYYFGLPFVAFLAATLVIPVLTQVMTWRTSAVTAFLSCTLLAGFVFGYYGKEKMYYFSKDEVAAAQYLNKNAPPGSLLVDGSWDWPLQYHDYEFYNYLSIASLDKANRLSVLNDPVSRLTQLMDDIPSQNEQIEQGQRVYLKPQQPPADDPADVDDYPAAYLIITRSQKAHIEMTGIMPAGSLDKIEQALLQSGHYQVVYANADAVILKLTNPPE